MNGIPDGRCTIVRKPYHPSDLRKALNNRQPEGSRSRSRLGLVSDGLRPLDILVAEDNAINALVLERYLKKVGHRITLVGDGALAVAQAAKKDFDVILMDVHMPVMEGLEATSQIRRMEVETGRNIHIIGLTADAMPGDRQRCLDAGMTDYLTKPVDFKELEKRLQAIQTAVPVE
jgi:CheY-like chemotaxis protein